MDVYYASPGSGSSFDFDAILGFLESNGAYLARHDTPMGEIVFFDEDEDLLKYYLKEAQGSEGFLLGAFVKRYGEMLMLSVGSDKALDRALIQHLDGTYGLTLEDEEGISRSVDSFL